VILMADDVLIIVFAKPAVPGAVKTRLLPTLTPEQAAEFHLAALSDVVAAARRTAHCLELHVAGGAEERSEFQARYPELPVLFQSEGELGARLAGALEGAFARRFARVLIVGSDHPTLPSSHLTQALEALDQADLVFGPSRDGGYYAVGARRSNWPAATAVFEGIPWSTGAVLQSSLERARSAGLSFALAPEWYDVDRPEDLRALRRDAPLESASLRFLQKMWGTGT
jgi:rSAM/selenodomain-associated transferase 1